MIEHFQIYMLSSEKAYGERRMFLIEMDYMEGGEYKYVKNSFRTEEEAKKALIRVADSYTDYVILKVISK